MDTFVVDSPGVLLKHWPCKISIALVLFLYLGGAPLALSFVEKSRQDCVKEKLSTDFLCYGVAFCWVSRMH